MSSTLDSPTLNSHTIYGPSNTCSNPASIVESTGADYGFAPSWSAIPLHLPPIGEAAEGTTSCVDYRGHRMETAKQDCNSTCSDASDCESGGLVFPVSASPGATTVTVSEEQLPPRVSHPPIREFLPQEQQYIKEQHQQDQNRRGIVGNNNANDAEHRCQHQHHSQHKEPNESTWNHNGEVSERSHRSRADAAAAGAAPGNTSLTTTPARGVSTSPRSTPPPSPQREQVSLPDDIYGAARVSEYWHGMHALSSLASAYVYDDIWAGDGGLNPREDIIGIAALAASDTASGGDASDEAKGVVRGVGADAPHTGKTIGSKGGPGRHGAGQREPSLGRRQPRRQKWAMPSGGDACGGGSSGDGGEARMQVDGHEMAQHAWESGGREDYSITSKKRRTPSPGSEEEALEESDDVPSAGGGGFWSASPRRAVVGKERCGGGADAMPTLRDSCKRVVSSPPRYCGGSTSGASSGEDENFFAGGVLDPAPRPPMRAARRREDGAPDSSVEHPRKVEMRDDKRSAAVSARGNWEGGRKPTETGETGWPPEAALAAAVVAGPPAGASDPRKFSHIEKEAFFCSHALEPSPRPDWHREALEECQTEGVATQSVADGIVVHRLAQGIGTGSPGDMFGPASEFERAPSLQPEPTSSSPVSPYPGMMSESFLSSADARAWSRGCVKKPKDKGSREPARAPGSRDGPGGSHGNSDEGGGGDGSGGWDWDWDVQPEAMAAFFTTVIKPKPQPLRGAGFSTELSRRSRTGAFASCESVGGIGEEGAAGKMTEAHRDATAAAATMGEDQADSRSDSGSGALDSCSTSYLAEAEAGSEESNAWGW